MKFRKKKIQNMKYILQTEMTSLEELLDIFTAVTVTNWPLCYRANEQEETGSSVNLLHIDFQRAFK